MGESQCTKKLAQNIGEKFELNHLVIQKPDRALLLNQEKFEFAKSAITLVQGESGVGKTTLFRALAGLWPYVSGNLTLPCKRDKIHVIPQQIFFPLCASLYEVIASSSNSLSSQPRINALLKEFKLEIADPSLKMNWATNLSFGEQQRIALIRAIIAEPELLLMDEPYSALDGSSRENCEMLLKKHLPHTTIICIDHHSLPDQQEASKEIYNHQVRVFDHQLHHEEVQKTVHSNRKVLASSI